MSRDLFSKDDEKSIAIVEREVGMLKKLNATHDAYIAHPTLDAMSYPTGNIFQLFQFPQDLQRMYMAVLLIAVRLMAHAWLVLQRQNSPSLLIF